MIVKTKTTSLLEKFDLVKINAMGYPIKNEIKVASNE